MENPDDNVDDTKNEAEGKENKHESHEGLYSAGRVTHYELFDRPGPPPPPMTVDPLLDASFRGDPEAAPRNADETSLLERAFARYEHALEGRMNRDLLGTRPAATRTASQATAPPPAQPSKKRARESAAEERRAPPNPAAAASSNPGPQRVLMNEEQMARELGLRPVMERIMDDWPPPPPEERPQLEANREVYDVFQEMGPEERKRSLSWRGGQFTDQDVEAKYPADMLGRINLVEYYRYMSDPNNPVTGETGIGAEPGPDDPEEWWDGWHDTQAVRAEDYEMRASDPLARGAFRRMRVAHQPLPPPWEMDERIALMRNHNYPLYYAQLSQTERSRVDAALERYDLERQRQRETRFVESFVRRRGPDFPGRLPQAPARRGPVEGDEKKNEPTEETDAAEAAELKRREEHHGIVQDAVETLDEERRPESPERAGPVATDAEIDAYLEDWVDQREFQRQLRDLYPPNRLFTPRSVRQPPIRSLHYWFNAHHPFKL